MVEFTNDLIGCRAQMKDIQSNQLIADTRINAYDSNKKMVKISASDIHSFGEREVSLLVFSKNELFEYFGNLKRVMIANEYEISLYSGGKKEDRKRKRYEIVAEGKVEGIVVNEQKIQLQKPIAFTTRNISADGLLIETMAGSFEKKNQIQVLIELGDNRLQGNYEVVRVQNQNLWTEEYGCRYIVPEEKV